MILTSRTPLRVSFFGGGTDYPEHFATKPGAVVGMAINKYIYISVLRLSNIIDHKFRISYSKLEKTQDVSSIEHPVVRSVLSDRKINTPLDINVMSDLPASSGLGSSSSFTVGFSNVINEMLNEDSSRLELALEAIRVEHDLLKERVGVQDQLHAAFGGLNRFDFEKQRIRITPVQMTAACKNRLTNSLILVFTGVRRHAHQVLDEQIKATKSNTIESELSHLMALTNQAVDLLEKDDPDNLLHEFGAMMREGWNTKRKLSSRISSNEIDELHNACLNAGAVGGKLCGAGGGGFLLMVVPPEVRNDFCEKMKNNVLIPVGMDQQGSVVLSG